MEFLELELSTGQGTKVSLSRLEVHGYGSEVKRMRIAIGRHNSNTNIGSAKSLMDPLGEGTLTECNLMLEGKNHSLVHLSILRNTGMRVGLLGAVLAVDIIGRQTIIGMQK